MTIVINKNVKVPMGGDFWDMPTRVKIGILLLVFGILLAVSSVMFRWILRRKVFPVIRDRSRRHSGKWDI